MNLPVIIRTVRWMVRDTIRQAFASKLAWVMMAVTAVCTLFCFSIKVSGDDLRNKAPEEIGAYITRQEAERLGWDKVQQDGVRVVSGEVSFGFGAVTAPIGKSRDDAVKFLQIWMTGIVADTIGVLLALLWTAAFLPVFLEPQSITVLLAKPVSRSAVLLGKYAGVVLFVGLQALLFVLGTWLGLGVSTGIWSGGYWVAVPLLMLNFAVFFSVSTFLAVWTRSAVACAFGTLLVWILCWAMNTTHHVMATKPVEGTGSGANTFMKVGYWVLPKPLDFSGIFFDAVGADGVAGKMPELKQLQEQGKFQPELAVLTSVLFAMGILSLACYELKSTDY